MLKLTIPASEQFDEQTGTFVYTKEQTLQLEHSLVSVSKWESKWKKPFLSKDGMTHEQSIDYLRCMTITQNVPDAVYRAVTPANLKRVYEYINDSMTATTFSKQQQKRFSREIITAEVIYYWMIFYGIPFECQKWHLNRLLTLINVCNAKSEKPKKMSKHDIAARNHSLNEARRRRLHTKG